MRLVLVVVVAACSNTHNSPPPASPAPPASPGPSSESAAPAAVTGEAFCEHLARLTRKCPKLANARVDPTTCAAQFRADVASSKDGKRIAQIARCVVEHDGCDEVLDCVAAGASDATASGALRACNDSSENTAEHAVGIPQAEWDRRRGARVTRFRDAQSTKAEPIEMCGISAANAWLTMLRCEDNSRPIKDRRDAEQARPGNVGSGGRCQSIIDHYVVPCPEASYEIFIDPYICPLPN